MSVYCNRLKNSQQQTVFEYHSEITNAPTSHIYILYTALT